MWKKRKSKKKKKTHSKNKKPNGIGRCDIEMVVNWTQSTLTRARFVSVGEWNCLIEGKNQRTKKGGGGVWPSGACRLIIILIEAALHLCRRNMIMPWTLLPSSFPCTLQSIRQTRRERLRATQANTKSRQKGNQIESANLSGEKQGAKEKNEEGRKYKRGRKTAGLQLKRDTNGRGNSA